MIVSVMLFLIFCDALFVWVDSLWFSWSIVCLGWLPWVFLVHVDVNLLVLGFRLLWMKFPFFVPLYVLIRPLCVFFSKLTVYSWFSQFSLSLSLIIISPLSLLSFFEWLLLSLCCVYFMCYDCLIRLCLLFVFRDFHFHCQFLMGCSLLGSWETLTN
jgi:hypothetical protein